MFYIITRCTAQAGSGVHENKKSRCTEVSVEHAHSQVRTPAWATFPVVFQVSCTVCLLTGHRNVSLLKRIAFLKVSFQTRFRKKRCYPCCSMRLNIIYYSSIYYILYTFESCTGFSSRRRSHIGGRCRSQVKPNRRAVVSSTQDRALEETIRRVYLKYTKVVACLVDLMQVGVGEIPFRPQESQ